MRAPEFWQAGRGGAWAPVLWPASALWAWVTRRRLRRAVSRDAGVPTICVGNVTAGGTGKTPLVRALIRDLDRRGRRPAILSRGYGGRARGPLRVDPERHDAGMVGDEPLELAAAAPTYIGRDRVAAARLAVAGGADCLILDDGFQDPALVKHLSFLVVDGAAGLGNGRVIPAGPCREPWSEAILRAQAVVVVGRSTGLVPDPCGRPLLEARLEPQEPQGWSGRRVVAFAGIGRPAKFFTTLEAMGADIVSRRAFADHHRYRSGELARLHAAARQCDATLVTTRKDWLRLPAPRRAGILVVDVDLAIDRMADLDALLDRVLGGV